MQDSGNCSSEKGLRFRSVPKFSTMATPFLLKPAECKRTTPLNVPGMPVGLKVSGANTQNELSIFIAEYVKKQGSPLHAHPVDETFYVLEGEHLFQVEEQQFPGSPGDVVFIPRNTPHTTLCLSDTGRLVFTINPSGTIEQVFQRLDRFKEIPPFEKIIRLHDELGVSILGPPLSVV